MAEETEFAMGATASCVDGLAGNVSRVIIDPATQTVTHLVIEPKHRLGVGRLVPLDLRTQMASCPSPIPVPRMKPTGSAMALASRAAALGPYQCDSVSQVISAVRPMHTTTKMTSVQTVERTERIFVHSARIRLVNLAWRPAAGPAGPRVGVTGDVVVIGPFPPRRSPHPSFVRRIPGCRTSGP